MNKNVYFFLVRFFKNTLFYGFIHEHFTYLSHVYQFHSISFTRDFFAFGSFGTQTIGRFQTSTIEKVEFYFLYYIVRLDVDKNNSLSIQEQVTINIEDFLYWSI